jgi:hypothetical protein
LRERFDREEKLVERKLIEKAGGEKADRES